MQWYLDNSYRQMHARLACATNPICPEKLYLDLTEDCNLSCRMCRDERSMCGKTMSMALFRRIVDETAPYVRSYSLFNWGESLLLSDFEERVVYLSARKRPDAILDISTNGTPLTDEKIAFLRAHDVAVVVSFDGARAETFEWIRRGARFTQVLRNTEKLARAYIDTPIERSPQMYVSIQKANADQIADIARLAHSIGVRHFGCGIVTGPAEYAPDCDDALYAQLEEAFAFVREKNMFLGVWPTKVGSRLFWGDRYVPAERFCVDTTCDAPMRDATIAWNGDVFLCCNVGEKAGNIADGSFLRLWQSERYNRLREAVNDEASMPERCRRCAWYNRNP